MSMALLVVRLQGRTNAEVARDYGVSRQWVHELVRRFDAEGEAGLQPRSRRPRASPGRTPEAIEDEIVEFRKELGDQGLDAGAHTIWVHLARRHGEAAVPSVATIWRILSRRGFVTPQPQKRPRSSFIRFQADLPNERWQADITHVKLPGGQEVEILNVIDDHSRFLVASDARVVFKAADVVASFHQAAASHGLPASLLTDNGAVFTAAPRGGRCAIELEADLLGIKDGPLEPVPPADLREGGAVPPDAQALARQATGGSDGSGAPDQLDRFRTYYNDVRPHRAIGRRTPAEAFAARPKATPSGQPIPCHYRVRRDRIDTAGAVTLRHDSDLLKIKVGRRHKGARVIMLVAGLDVRIVNEDGEVLRELTLDPSRLYQPLGRG